MAITQSGNDFYMRKGDTAVLNFDFNIDITGATLYFTVKKNLSDSDSAAAIAKVQTTHTDPTEGQTTITITNSDSDIDLGGYYYDCQITLASGAVHTVLPSNASTMGRFNITQEVTQS